jgi:phosphotriesterase-related protein
LIIFPVPCDPAYDLLDAVNDKHIDYQILHTSRGCKRKCSFCGTWRIEPNFTPLTSIKNKIHYKKLVFYDNGHWLHKADDDLLIRLFISEIKEGMYIDADYKAPEMRCSARAGIIKAAVDSDGIKDGYIKLFNAVAVASVMTAVPIMCHIEKGADAMAVVDFLVNRGVRLETIILCHLDRARYDPDYHREIAETGVYLEYDTIARFKYHSNEMEIKLVYKLLENGFEDKILLGLDTTRERLKSYNGSIGLDYLRNTFIPLMLESGIDHQAIHKMTVSNPKKVLAIKS